MKINNFIFFICSSKIWILFLFLTVIVLFYKILKIKYQRDPRLVRFSNTLSGPRELLVFGNRYSFLFSGIQDVEKKLSQYTEEYGSTFRLWIKNQLVVVVSDVDHLKDIFNSTKVLDKPEIFEPWRTFLSHTIFKSEGHIWKMSRKRMQPYFKKNEIKCQLSIINDTVRKYVTILEKHSNGPEFSIWDYLPYIGCDIFTNVYLDFQLNWDEKLNFKFQEFSRMVEEIGNSRTFIPWLKFQFIADFVQKNRLNASELRRHQFHKVLREKMFLKQKELRKQMPLDKYRKSLELFPMLVELENELGIYDYAADEIISFLATVSDNVSMISGYFLLSVAMQTDIQEKLYEEIYSIFGDEERPVEYADLLRLTYMDQVLKETERRFPVFVFMLRNVKEDCKIGSTIYPAGTQIMIRMADVHFNPTLYPNPYKFNPDNFSREATSKRSKYSFIPFSIGARDCLGKNFADTIMKITLVWLLRRFTFHTTAKEDDFLGETAFVPYEFGIQKLSIKFRKPRYL